jgi:hypothetical protein
LSLLLPNPLKTNPLKGNPSSPLIASSSKMAAKPENKPLLFPIKSKSANLAADFIFSSPDVQRLTLWHALTFVGKFFLHFLFCEFGTDLSLLME